MRFAPRWLAQFAVRSFPRFYARRQRPIARHQPWWEQFRFVPRVEQFEDREAPGSTVALLGFGAAGLVSAPAAAELICTPAERIAVVADAPASAAIPSR